MQKLKPRVRGGSGCAQSCGTGSAGCPAPAGTCDPCLCSEAQRNHSDLGGSIETQLNYSRHTGVFGGAALQSGLHADRLGAQLEQIVHRAQHDVARPAIISLRESQGSVGMMMQLAPFEEAPAEAALVHELEQQRQAERIAVRKDQTS